MGRNKDETENRNEEEKETVKTRIERKRGNTQEEPGRKGKKGRRRDEQGRKGG